MERVRSLAIAGTIGLAALLMSSAGPRAWAAEGKLILEEDTHWKVWAVRGAMRIDGKLLKDKAECKKWGVTPGDVKSIGRATKRLLQGQNIDWKKNDWRDFAAYCPDIIGNPYYPRMMSLVRQEYPPEGWISPGFDDGAWMTVWNTTVRGVEGKGSVYNRSMYMRTYFEVPDPAKVKELVLTLAYRGGCRVLINGREIARGHLPEGQLTAGVCGDSYVAEAYYNHREESADRKTVVAIGEIWTRFIKGGRSKDPRLRRYRCPAPPQWNGYKGPWLDRKGWQRLMKLRDREIGPVNIPSKLLVKGRNVLAVELHGSRHHPLIYAPGIWGHGKTKQWNQAKSWDHARLVRLRLDDPSGSLPSAMQPPEELGVWAEDMHSRLYRFEYRPTVMPTGKLKFVGALNGNFAGMLSVMSGRKITGLAAVVSDLKHVAGDATIPAGRIRVTGMVGQPVTDMAQLGVHIKGLDRKPMNFMARNALAHTMQSPFFSRPRQRDRDWQAKAAEKVLFYDHIASVLPATVPANVLQPLWVRLSVPTNTPPGVYRGQITIKADAAKPVAVPVEAEIIDWRGPAPHPCRPCNHPGGKVVPQ